MNRCLRASNTSAYTQPARSGPRTACASRRGLSRNERGAPGTLSSKPLSELHTHSLSRRKSDGFLSLARRPTSLLKSGFHQARAISIIASARDLVDRYLQIYRS